MAAAGSDPPSAATSAHAQEEEAEAEADDRICAVCHEVYKVPKLLECTHTFCQQCLVDFVGSASRFSCPMCRRDIKVPPGGVAALRNNPYLRRKDLDQARRIVYCRQHARKEVELYCQQCQTPVCVLCMMQDHTGVSHHITTIAQQALSVADQLAEDRNRIDQAVTEVKKHVTEGQDKLQTLQEKKVAVEKDIRLKHASIITVTDRLRDEALASLESVSGEIEQKLNSDLKQIRTNLSDLLKLQSTVEKATGDATDHERVTVAKDMRCGAGSPDTVQRKASLRMSTVSRPVLRCSEADLSPVVSKMEDFMGQVVRLERRESLALRRDSGGLKRESGGVKRESGGLKRESWGLSLAGKKAEELV